MKSVTEFWSFALLKGLKAKEALVAEGKSPEEIQTSLGETFKFEGDKLKYFVNALEVAALNQEKLSRVYIVSLNEGEKVPDKATKFEELHYVPDFQVAPKPVNTAKTVRGAGGGGKKKQGGPKEGPWGPSPEQRAAKKGGGGAKPS